MPLTPKQQRFVQEYVVDLNATAAYRRAGYAATGRSAENAASRLLGNVGVQAAIAEAQAARAISAQVRAEQVLRELARVGLSDPRRLFDANGAMQPPAAWSDDLAAAVAAVETREEWMGTGEDRRLVGYMRKVRLWDKVAALEKLAKHLGLLKEQLEVTGVGRIAFIEVPVVATTAAPDRAPHTP